MANEKKLDIANAGSWADGFGAGVVWAASVLSGNFGEAVRVGELCSRGGDFLRELRYSGVSDREATAKVISQILGTTPATSGEEASTEEHAVSPAASESAIGL